MDALQIAIALGTIVFGSGGIFALFRVRQSRQKGVPPTEGEAQMAAVIAASPANSGWDALAAHYQEELDSLRGDLRRELEGVRKQVAQLTRNRELDAAYIDSLEAHIWQWRPPPPPPRPSTAHHDQHAHKKEDDQ